MVMKFTLVKYIWVIYRLIEIILNLNSIDQISFKVFWPIFFDS